MPTQSSVATSTTRTFIVALAGQPNTGKSTVFNRITGSRQHVGNWPGKTVEQKTGTLEYKGDTYRVVDLPGTYSLTANSIEETIARDFIIDGHPDVVVVVVDASQMERTLYMVAETIQLPSPVIVALNMMDVAEHEGGQVDAKALETSIGVKVVPMVASRNKGVSELLETIHNVAHDGKEYSPSRPEIGGEYRSLLEDVQAKISGHVPAPYSDDWVAIKLLENDKAIAQLMKSQIEPGRWKELSAVIEQNDKGQLIAASARYEWIESVTSVSIKHPEQGESVRRGTRFDRMATHRIWGPFVALGIVLATIIAVMAIGMPFSFGIISLLPMLSGGTMAALAGAPAWLSSMVAEGLIPGIGVTLSVLLFMMAVFLVVGFLEDIGYMPRLAYVTDRFMRRLGLHGKSFMPLFMSFTCNMIGVMGSRMVDSWRQRLTTLILAPIIPCMAVWAVVGFVGAVFFGVSAPLVMLALLVVMVLHLFVTSFLLRHTVLAGESIGLIMELPPYHRPNWSTIWNYVWTHAKAFLKRGGTIIALLVVVIWALSYFPSGAMETSLLASVGKVFQPVGNLMGMDWRLVVSLIVGFISKEAALASMAVLYGIGSATSTTVPALMLGGATFEHAALGSTMMATISPATALAFVFALFFSIPCLATVGIMYGETKSLKWTVGGAAYYVIASLVFGIIAYNVGLLIF